MALDFDGEDRSGIGFPTSADIESGHNELQVDWDQPFSGEVRPISIKVEGSSTSSFGLFMVS